MYSQKILSRTQSLRVYIVCQKLTLTKTSFWNIVTIRVSNTLGPVGLQMLSADDTQVAPSKERVNLRTIDTNNDLDL